MSVVIQLWLPEQPLACSRPTTEACKIPSLEGLLDWRCLEVNANFLEVNMCESRFRVHLSD